MKKKTNEKGLFFDGPDTRLSYLDFGGEGTTILALHGHMNEGRFAEGLAENIQEALRLIRGGTVNPAVRQAMKMTCMLKTRLLC
ncbi:hypothetical protein [Fictibacillus sp. WQ 8-8]|uniref:hypothetical protein n=1 Tax=Fictibacillus sp. WQ 8-8 TaxID=2938788 RepID=UPI00210A9800|nr:hypothetical protein [Fictibacillus sp. WQ 8-8]